MVSQVLKERAVTLINEYNEIHRDLQQLDEELSVINEKKRDLFKRLTETREAENVLISEVKAETGHSFNIIEFVQTLLT